MMRKISAPVISLLLSVCMLLSGCSNTTLLQPSREDIVGANLYLLTEPIELTLDLKLMAEEGAILYYNSVVTVCNEDAVWEGYGKIRFGNLYFKQDCQTVCSASGSRKQWRGSWAASNTVSPTSELSKWLEKVTDMVSYHTTPVAPSEYSDYLSSFTDPAYRIEWTEEAVNWTALCDVHPDTMFGSNELLTSIQNVNITMFFGTDDLLLDVVLITTQDMNGKWLNFSLAPRRAEQAPQTSWEGKIEQNILLNEEWNVIYSHITGDDTIDPTE